MGTVILNMFFIALICVFIVDISGAVESFKSALRYISTKGKMSGSNYTLKPFDCSLCATFWASMVYLLVMGLFQLKFIAIACVICTFCGLIKTAILLIEDILVKVIQLIYKYWIDK